MALLWVPLASLWVNSQIWDFTAACLWRELHSSGVKPPKFWRALGCSGVALGRRAGRAKLVTRCVKLKVIVVIMSTARCHGDMLVGATIGKGEKANERMGDCGCAALRLRLC